MDRERIRKYLRQGEKAPPSVFVGRDNILEDILSAARDSAGQPGMTRIVQGAPGAGKSSLLHEMQKRWTGANDTPRVVILSASALMRDVSLGFREILAARLLPEKQWMTFIKSGMQWLDSFSIGGVSVSFERKDMPKTLQELGQRYPMKKWPRKVIVAVDEAQRFAGDRTTAEANFLQEIHDGNTGLPLILVLAGLSDTYGRAREMHLTRIVHLHEAEPMKDAETRHFMERLGQWFDLDISRHLPLLYRLADFSDGWPRHLYYAGETLAREAQRVDGDMDRMDWPAMERMAWTLRQKYYEDQSRTMMQDTDMLVARVMSELRDGMHFGDVQALVENAVVDRPRQRLPGGMNSESFLNELIHQGALYRNLQGRVHSPIPSFRTWLIKAGTGSEPSLERRIDDSASGCGL